MAKKISAINPNKLNGAGDLYAISDDEIVKSKKKVNEKLSQVLNKQLKFDIDEDEEIEDIDFIEKFIGFLGKISTHIDEQISSMESLLLEESLNPSEKKELKTFLTRNLEKTKQLPSLIQFFENNEVLNTLSFDALINLISLNLKEKELKNLIKIADTEGQRDIGVKLILENVGDKVVFSNNITNKIIKLSEIESYHEEGSFESIDFYPEDYILLKDIKLSKGLIDKIKTLIECGVNISIKDFEDLDKLKIYKTLVNKLKNLENKVHIYFKDLPIVDKIDFNEDLLKKINSLKELGLNLYGENLLTIQKLTKSDIEKLEHINKLGGKDEEFYGFDFILKLKISEIDKIIGDIKKLGLDVYYDCFEVLYNIPEEILQYCIKNNIKDISDINKVKEMYSISSRETMKRYIHRKNEYLEKNRTLPEEKYIEYFGGKGKFGKYDINQGNIGLCYLYSGLEMLKKMNGFAELVQSNLIEEDDGWLVRFPFNIGSWIKVKEDEIDKIYEIEDKWRTRKMNINSRSEYLGFKILEIAYIKNKLINRMRLNKSNYGSGEKDEPLNIEITGKMLRSVEGGETINALKELLSKKNIIKGAIMGYNITYGRHERLSSFGAPELVLKTTKKDIDGKDNRIDLLFELFGTGFIFIELAPHQNFSPMGEWMEKIERGKKFDFLVDKVKVLDKSGEEVQEQNLKNFQDVVQESKGNKKVRFLSNHAYSVEKCYIDDNGEKRVRVVNPWHTGIKFELSLDQCKKLFNWQFGVINIDKLFR